MLICFVVLSSPFILEHLALARRNSVQKNNVMENAMTKEKLDGFLKVKDDDDKGGNSSNNSKDVADEKFAESKMDNSKEGEGKKNISREVALNNNTLSTSTACRQVYFWGGGKAGSTSLFFTLVRGPGGLFNPQNTGPFVRDLGKEPCQGSEWNKWVALTKDTNLCSGGGSSGSKSSFTHILNGCPRETSASYARKAMALSDDPKFIMLIRDPVDRFVSLLNDQVRRGGSRMNIEDAARKQASSNNFGMTLVKQGAALKNLLSVVKDHKRILIIPMESISVNAEGVIDSIMDHVGGQRWKRNETDGVKMNVGSNTNKYINLSHNTTEILRNSLRQDVQLLESLVGKRFLWSSWARKNNDDTTGEVEKEQKSEAWLVTTPVSDYS